MTLQRRLIQRTIARGRIQKWSPEDFVAADLGELLARVVEAGRNAFENASCGLFLLAGDHLELVATAGIALPPVEQRRIGLDDGLFGKTMKRGEPLLVLSLAGVAKDDLVCSILPGDGSLMVVPFGFQGRPLGLIGLCRRGYPAFTHDDLQNATLFASHVAWAITIQRLLDRRTQDLLAQQAARDAMEAELRKAQKMEAIGCLAAGVAHEINNPLGVILGFAQSLERRVPDGDPLRLPVTSIVREALRCKSLVQELLVFSRTAKKSGEPVDLNELLRSTKVLLEARARTQQVALLDEIPTGPAIVVANRTQLQQVVVNLGNNALDAMPAGGTLTLRTTSGQEEGIFLEVADTGEGIPEDVRAHIFEPFFTTKEVGKGTGLGLSLVYEIVQQHGGSIDLSSKLGAGTCVRIRFPVAARGER